MAQSALSDIGSIFSQQKASCFILASGFHPALSTRGHHCLDLRPARLRCGIFPDDGNVTGVRGERIVAFEEIDLNLNSQSQEFKMPVLRALFLNRNSFYKDVATTLLSNT